jgi:hypothetical protein
MTWQHTTPQTIAFQKNRPSGGDEFADWDSNIIEVKDGGSDFWGVIFDMDTHSFDKLIVNGTS